MDRVEQLKKIQNEALELFQKKNKDYGDAFATFGLIGVLVRLEDKIQRSLTISEKGVNLVEEEKLRDTLLDLHNYAAMGLMFLEK
jgi:beta-glucosidase/6-phospho-beta-glucosidase/beta-galactosidase